MGEGQLAVLLHRGEAEVLAAEEEQSIEEDDGGVRPQLLTVPQELLLHTGMDVTCRGEVKYLLRAGQTFVWNRQTEVTDMRNSPLAVIEGLKPLSMLVNSVENLL